MSTCNLDILVDAPAPAASRAVLRPEATALAQRKVVFRGRLVVLGFGCVGQGVLPLLLRHIDMPPHRVLVIVPSHDAQPVAEAYGVSFLALRITAQNLHTALEPYVDRGDFLLNVSVDVSSLALLHWCRTRGAMYLDTCIEPWAGGHLDATQPMQARTNYALREAALALRGADRDGPTAVLTHGANPGLVSYLFKQALLNLADDLGYAVERPTTREAWARLAALLDVRVVHVAESDSQRAALCKQPGEFVNTWSASAFVEEACQPAELGWGSHERHFPHDGARHMAGSCASIFLRRPGAATQVRSWTPASGPMHGFLVTHAESISMADHFTLVRDGTVAYRPTVHYAYRPCADAILSLRELAERDWHIQSRTRLLRDDITEGTDTLGVLLMGHERNAYWYGSQLSIAQARKLCPHNSATSLQVTASVMAGVVWALQNPQCDVVEPDDLPFDVLLALCLPYLGEVGGFYTDWNPLAGRNTLFAEDLDRSDPWQFKNFRVV